MNNVINLDPLIIDAAKRHNLDPAIIHGLIIQESDCDQYAARYEPNYTWLYKPRDVKPSTCSLYTEQVLQKTSIGLMQTMGALCRELGFRGWLTELFSRADLQIDYGCKHLAAKLLQYGTIERALSAYNAGSPTQANITSYVNRVLTFAGEWQVK